MKLVKELLSPFSKVGNSVVLISFLVQLIFILGLWQFSTHSLFPQPTEVLAKVIELLTDMEFYRNVFQSLSLTIQAMFYSIIIACILGYAYTIPALQTLVNFITKLRYLTLVGLVFSFTVIFKDGQLVSVLLLMFGIIPFFVLSLVNSITEIQQKEFDVCKTIGMNRWRTLLELVIIGRAEQTIETIRSNFAIAWLMITMVETYSMSKGGIGVMLFIANKYNQLETIFALQVLIFMIGFGFDYILSKVRISLFPHIKLTTKK